MPAFQPTTAVLPAVTLAMPFARSPAFAVRPPQQAMDAPSRPPAPSATRWDWQSRFGTIVIEVRGHEVFVNGDRVEPHAP